MDNFILIVCAYLIIVSALWILVIVGFFKSVKSELKEELRLDGVTEDKELLENGTVKTAKFHNAPGLTFVYVMFATIFGALACAMILYSK